MSTSKSKDLSLLVGFIMFLLGILSIVLSLVGLRFVFLEWMDLGGSTWGLVFRLLFILGGVVLMAYSRINWGNEESRNIPD
jgi:hypothetical protein